MKLLEQKFDVGVIVGRFQVDRLHDAHISLIEGVVERHPKVIIFLGVPPTILTRNNPLDFEARKQMIVSRFPDVNVLYHCDSVSDQVWSENLDKAISTLTTPNQKVVLYGGRDSFKKHYSGRYTVLEIEEEGSFSGTVARQDASVRAINSSDFRAGIIWAVYNRHATAYTTVDIAVFNENETEILLARKPHETQWRFIGGFAEPDSNSFEEDARREVQEEANISITNPIYVGSFKVSDWRYEKEHDKIKTLLFKAKYFSGQVKAGDDVEEVKWTKVGSIKLNDIAECHRPLMKTLLRKGD